MKTPAADNYTCKKEKHEIIPYLRSVMIVGLDGLHSYSAINSATFRYVVKALVLFVFYFSLKQK